jgi:phosphotriesterase-related protein
MVSINSVAGKIDSSQLGNTLVHEHLCIRDEAVLVQFPHLYNEDDEFERAVNSLNAVKKHGIKTICDPTVLGIGRDIRFIEKAASETGVNVISATGLYTFHYIPLRFQTREVDYMTDLFVRDINIGVQNTVIKAGFLKCATDKQGITPDVEKVLRAVARAHHKTGVPIMTHSHPASGTGLKQLDIFDEEGVDPKYILIGHSGDTDDIDYLLKIIDRGAYIGMDRFGITRTISNESRTATVIELANRGYADRMFLSHDYCCSRESYRTEAVLNTYYKKSSMTYLMDEIIPELKNNGIIENQIHTMMTENIQRWFEGK